MPSSSPKTTTPPPHLTQSELDSILLSDSFSETNAPKFSPPKSPTRKCPHIKSIKMSKIRDGLQALKNDVSSLKCRSCESTRDSQSTSALNPASRSSPKASRKSSASKPVFATSTEIPATLKVATTSDISSNNLWLCLTCGKVHCGRQDSSHALEHNSRFPGHHLVLDMGSFECWCYGCDEYVEAVGSVNRGVAEVGNQVRSLVRKGIVVAGVSDGGSLSPPMVTPNSPHHSVDFPLRDETLSSSRSPKKPAPSPAFPGLSNLGNTCFFNSVMQCITHSPYFLASLPSISGLAITSAFVSVSSQLSSQSAQSTVVNPLALFTTLSKKYRDYKSMRQQDAHELLRRLLDGIREEEITVLKSQGTPGVDEKMDSEAVALTKATVIDDVFGGELVSIIVCDGCGEVSTSHETFLDLSLPILTLLASPSAPSPSTKPKPLRKKLTSKRRKSRQSSMTDGLAVTSPPKKGRSSQNPFHEEVDCGSLVLDETFGKDGLSEGEEDGEGESIELEAEPGMNIMEQKLHSLALTPSHLKLTTTPKSTSKTTSSRLATLLRTITFAPLPSPTTSEPRKTILSLVSEFLSVEILEGDDSRRCEGCFLRKYGLSWKEYSTSLSLSKTVNTLPNPSSPTQTRATSQKQLLQQQTPLTLPLSRAFKRYMVTKLPRVLVLHLKRFMQVVNGRTRKVEEWVGVLEEFDFGWGVVGAGDLSAGDKIATDESYETTNSEISIEAMDWEAQSREATPSPSPTSPSSPSTKYTLSGIVSHSGSISGGHYIAYVKTHLPDGTASWTYASDGSVRSVTREEVLKAQAYIVFYERE